MNKNIFFNSSLPRSGSTLFSNIIGQDTRFFVTPTSGLLELLYSSREVFSKLPEFKAQNKEQMEEAFRGFCSAGLQGYFKNITKKKYILDKSRGWAINYKFLNAFYENPKIVTLIRNPADIFSSMEKKFRNVTLKSSDIQIHSELKNTTLEKRMDFWVNTPPVGLAFERLQEIIRMGIHSNILFIKYEELCTNPNLEIDKFYEYAGISKNSKIDFNNITQVTYEDDSIYGIFGDHKIRSKVMPNKSDAEEILGNELIKWIKNRYSWFYEFFKYKT